jgi:hypothetical protein
MNMYEAAAKNSWITRDEYVQSGSEEQLVSAVSGCVLHSSCTSIAATSYHRVHLEMPWAGNKAKSKVSISSLEATTS